MPATDQRYVRRDCNGLNLFIQVQTTLEGIMWDLNRNNIPAAIHRTEAALQCVTKLINFHKGKKDAGLGI